MSYVSKIQTNVKGDLTVDLAPLTIVVGPNASHKSGLVAAIELIVTGRSRELGALPSEIMSLAPGGADHVEVRAQINGSEAVFSVSGSTAKATKPRYSGPYGQVYGQNLAEILRADQKRLRAILLAAICGDIGDLETLAAKHLPDAFLPEWKSRFSAINAESPLDALILFLADLKSEKLAASKIRMPEDECPTGPTDAEIAELEAKLASPPKAQVVGNPAATEAMYLATTAGRIYDRLKDKPECLVCGSGREMWEEDRASSRREAIKERARVLLQASVEEENDNDADDQRKVQEELSVLYSAKARVEHWQSLRAQAVEAMKNKDLLAALLRATDAMVAELLEGEVKNFTDAMQVAMSGLEPVVQLIDKGKPVCRLGISRDSRLISWKALSGAERARFLAGLACAMARKEKGMKIVVIDEVWLNAVAQAKLCAGLEKAVEAGAIDQAIVCLVERGWRAEPDSKWKEVCLEGREQ